eukprot:5647300-Pyramimonas_sp.AAC.1
MHLGFALVLLLCPPFFAGAALEGDRLGCGCVDPQSRMHRRSSPGSLPRLGPCGFAVGDLSPIYRRYIAGSR